MTVYEYPPNLFGYVHSKTDSMWLAKSFFNVIAAKYGFLSAIDSLLNGLSLGDEYVFCQFPDPEEENGDFEGVKFLGWTDDLVLSITDEIFDELITEACQLHLKYSPATADRLKAVFRRHGKELHDPRTDLIVLE